MSAGNSWKLFVRENKLFSTVSSSAVYVFAVISVKRGVGGEQTSLNVMESVRIVFRQSSTLKSRTT